MKFTNVRSTLFGAALICTSLVGCGDDGGNNTLPDGGGGSDASAEPLEPGIAITDLERVVDVTSDGRTVLFWKQSTGELYFYDTASGQLDLETTLEGSQTELLDQQPHAMSDVGHIVAGYGYQEEAASRWDATNGWKKLKNPVGACPTEGTAIATGGAHGISNNGNFVVGLLWDANCKSQAFLWKDTGGDGTMIPLQKIGTGTIISERASVVSNDGKVAAGFAPNGDGVDRSPAIWKDDGTGFLIDPSDVQDPGEIKAISADGNVFAGEWATLDTNYAFSGMRSGFVWSQETGVVRFSSATPSHENIYANAISADGKNVYGLLHHWADDMDAFSQESEYAYVWSKDKGLRNLQDVATAAGITVPANHILTNVIAVSADGRVIVGDAVIPPDDPNTGIPTPKLFVLVLPDGAL